MMRTTSSEANLSLPEILYAAFGHRMGDQLFQSLSIHIGVAVLDTNVLLNDLRGQLRGHQCTPLQVAGKMGAVRFFAATSIRDEMEEKIDELATPWHWDSSHARDVWQREYRFVHFLDPTGVRLRSGRLSSVMDRDPDDVPTALLVELLKPDVLLSLDSRHLGTFGPAGSPRAAASAYRTVALRDSTMLGVISGGSIAAVALTEIGRLILAGACRARRQLLLAGGMLTIAALAASHLPAVQTRWPHFFASLSRLGKALMSGLGEGGKALSQLEDQRRSGLITLSQSGCTSSNPQTALEYLAMILARTPRSLSTSEIARSMTTLGYKPRGSQHANYAARILAQHPGLFVRDRVGWHIASV